MPNCHLSPTKTSARRLDFTLLVLLLLIVGLAPPSVATAADANSTAELSKSRARAVNFLKTTQADDGSWTTNQFPGITGLVTFALLKSGVPSDDPTIAKALANLESYVQKDGGIYANGSRHRNYESCIVLVALQAANSDKRYDKLIANGEKFLKGLQWDEGEGLESSDTAFGGAGYGSSERPDLSNTAYLIEALKAAGVKSDDEALKKALVFVSRCQNLETEHNNTPFAAAINDGGFYYTPAAGGSSQAGKTDEGGLRSYGSMTYAGLKSMIYAGLTADDPRVKAAQSWIRKHYTVDENPGVGQNGLYYYFHTFSKALHTLNVEEIEDASGVKHNWKQDLTSKLIELQRENGSWVNSTPRWYEGDPNLATSYALMALAYCGAQPDR